MGPLASRGVTMQPISVATIVVAISVAFASSTPVSAQGGIPNNDFSGVFGATDNPDAFKNFYHDPLQQLTQFCQAPARSTLSA